MAPPYTFFLNLVSKEERRGLVSWPAGGLGNTGRRKESLRPSWSGCRRKRASLIREECAEPAGLVSRSPGLICHSADLSSTSSLARRPGLQATSQQLGLLNQKIVFFHPSTCSLWKDSPDLTEACCSCTGLGGPILCSGGGWEIPSCFSLACSVTWR